MTQQVPEGYIITTDRKLLKVEQVHYWLSTQSYWAQGIPFELVETAFDNSFVAGVLHGNRQVGFARLVTDYAVFAYLADVYVEEAHRGKGLSKAMMQMMMEQPWVSQLRRLSLATLDAHGLYRQFGFTPLQFPERMMEIARPNLYQEGKTEEDILTSGAARQ